MAIEKMPTTLAPRKPQHAAWYKVHKVKDGENWWSLAKEHHLDVWQLIYFNFRTHDPDEVNWYLRHYVGCTLQTPDKKNFRFSSNADPGLIYIPVQPAVLGPVPRAEKPPSTVPWKLVFRWMHLSGKIAEAEKRLTIITAVRRCVNSKKWQSRRKPSSKNCGRSSAKCMSRFAALAVSGVGANLRTLLIIGGASCQCEPFGKLRIHSTKQSLLEKEIASSLAAPRNDMPLTFRPRVSPQGPKVRHSAGFAFW